MTEAAIIDAVPKQQLLPAGEVSQIGKDLTPLAPDNSECDARLAEIEIIFDHQQMPLLEKLELAKEYVEIAQLQISRQDVAKSPGRPEGAISIAARRLTIPGRTGAGRRKWLERALKIANLTPAVKAAARETRVAKFQSRLIEIANVEGEAAQLQKVQEIAKRQSKKVCGDDGVLRAVVRYPADSKSEFLRRLTELVEEFGAKLDP